MRHGGTVEVNRLSANDSQNPARSASRRDPRFARRGRHPSPGRGLCQSEGVEKVEPLVKLLGFRCKFRLIRGQSLSF
jgi:hypothetical protein